MTIQIYVLYRLGKCKLSSYEWQYGGVLEDTQNKMKIGSPAENTFSFYIVLLIFKTDLLVKYMFSIVNTSEMIKNKAFIPINLFMNKLSHRGSFGHENVPKKV